MKVAVLYGGTSAEREVSLSSGRGIMEALKQKGHEVIGIDFHPNMINDILTLDVDIVFIGLHGRLGEDGSIQSLLDLAGIPYVGSGVLASALAMDKAKSKVMFANVGIRTAQDVILQKSTFSKEDFNLPFSLPIVIKPNREGSTIGLTIAHDEEEVLKGLEFAFEHDEEIMIEQYVKGTEVTIAVIGERGKEQAMPIIEIVPKNKYYDYESKYAPGGSEHIIPARINDEVTQLLLNNAVLAHQVLGCEVYSRADFIIPDNGEKPVILEVNTLPGMTPTSLFPDAAKYIGIKYEEMIEELVNLSLKKR
ncbi:D-alanine--D-alanine ligase [Bacillus solimangrovi]|uniref:D-alanine--D-alanine ligase n=1 Tax=Bacillus solimangrovi TaxID=1305675 RepID=A0A1E5LHC9_9BACI|nr:D-alanine--D-alanine ligase [Bacillus solimangrovi]OEH93483.1 D-alanine--D-alanine ligase [Bacillus solimangrovi]